MFAFNIERLDPANDGDRRARQLLARAAQFAPGEAIAKPLLLATIARDEGASFSRTGERAVRRLVDLGLLEPAESNAVRMHRLVAAFVKRELARDEDETAVQETLVRTARRQERAVAMSPDGRALQAHLRFVADGAVQHTGAQSAELCSVLGVHLRAQGDYLQASVFLDRALQIRQTRLSPDHPEIIWSLHDLGHVFKDLGKLAEAQSRLKQSLDVRRRMLGPCTSRYRRQPDRSRLRPQGSGEVR